MPPTKSRKPGTNGTHNAKQREPWRGGILQLDQLRKAAQEQRNKGLSRRDAIDAVRGWALGIFDPPPRERDIAGAVDSAYSPRPTKDQPADHWDAILPLTGRPVVPSFPLSCLPGVLCDWCQRTAEAYQVPIDVVANLALSVCAAGIAGKVRVEVRPGWTEPTNLFTVTALPSSDRKSAVFRAALAPVRELEARLLAEQGPAIAVAESEHRQLEQRLKRLEDKIAKAASKEAAEELRHKAWQVAYDLAEHKVPVAPQLTCDDLTVEKLGQLLYKHGGRMFQAGPEGTAFEMVKGRYSDAASFDVYLKGHSGDALRVQRLGREDNVIDQPALTCALCVQPHVVAGLGEHTSLAGCGFLARWLFALPVSKVGSRKIRPDPVPDEVAAAYRDLVHGLWSLRGSVDEQGQPVPRWLVFSQEANDLMAEAEAWLEPQLAEGQPLSHLSGWAGKMLGAAARIAAVLHMAEGGADVIGYDTALAALVMVKDYYLGHALAAFALLRADGRLEDARRAVRWVGNQFRENANGDNYSIPRRERRRAERVVNLLRQALRSCRRELRDLLRDVLGEEVPT